MRRTIQHPHSLGFTLIEVLIALAIVSIAMTAIIKTTVQNIRASMHLQNKTQAMWIAKEVMNEVKLGLIVLPNDGEVLKKTTHMLNKDWYWHAVRQSTPNKRIHKIAIKVYAVENEDEDEEEGTPLLVLENYQYDQSST